MSEHFSRAVNPASTRAAASMSHDTGRLISSEGSPQLLWASIGIGLTAEGECRSSGLTAYGIKFFPRDSIRHRRHIEGSVVRFMDEAASKAAMSLFNM
jgi:hypothetical protein